MKQLEAMYMSDWTVLTRLVYTKQNIRLLAIDEVHLSMVKGVGTGTTGTTMVACHFLKKVDCW